MARRNVKKRIQVSKSRLVTEEEENHQKEQDEFVEVSTEPEATHQMEEDEQYSNIFDFIIAFQTPFTLFVVFS